MESPNFKTLAIRKKRKKILIAILAIIFVVAIIVAVYPFLPLLKYNFSAKPEEIPGVPEMASNEKGELEDIASGSFINNNTQNLLIIPKIGVKIPIVEGKDESVLNRGAWRLPETSTPDKGSNTVIAGHRWQYRPPSEKTFYLLDKLDLGDTFQVLWNSKEYNYKVVSISIVLPTDLEVLDSTPISTVTLLTCHPLFSTKQRLIVRGEKL